MGRLEGAVIFAEIIGRDARLLCFGQGKPEPCFCHVAFDAFAFGQHAAEKYLPVRMAFSGGAAEQLERQPQILIDHFAVKM